MANSFTVFPNVLPGNVTIGGNLTVAGDQLKIGAAAPFVRLGKDNSSSLHLSQNIGFDQATRDIGATEAFRIQFNFGGRDEFFERLNAAGNSRQGALPLCVFTDFTTHANHTGTTTEDTIYSKTIRGGIIGANGALLVRVLIATGAQGAPNSSLRVRLGANAVVTKLFNTGADNFLMEVIIANQNSQAAQQLFATTTDFVAKTRDGSTASGTTDTSADQTLSVTIQNGTSTDVQTPQFVTADLINSFGPV